MVFSSNILSFTPTFELLEMSFPPLPATTIRCDATPFILLYLADNEIKEYCGSASRDEHDTMIKLRDRGRKIISEYKKHINV